MAFKPTDAADTKCDVNSTTSAQASQEANCGDQTKAVTPDTGSQHVPEIGLYDSSALSDQALETKAEALRDAFSTDWLKLKFSSDFNSAMDIVGEMNQAQMARFIPIYNALPDRPDLLDDARSVFSGTQFREFETKVQTQDGQTNFAGNVATFLEKAKEFGGQAEAGSQMRALFGHMSSADIETAKQQWQQGDYSQYGSFDEMVASSSLSDLDKHLYQTLFSKGRENWTSADIEAAAKYLVNSVDYRVTGPQDELMQTYADVVGGTTAAAVEARADLLKEQSFVDKYKEVFGTSQYVPGTKYWEDYLTGPGVSLATTVQDNTGLLAGVFGNQENVDFDIQNASPAERQEYTAGRLIAESGVAPTTDEQRAQLDFYTKTLDAFDNKGAQQAAIWADELENGRKTVASDLAQQSMDGTLSRQTALLSLAKMSEADWQLLQPVNGVESPFMSQLKATVGQFLPADAPELIQRMHDMSEAGSFAKAQEVNHSFSDSILNNAGPDGIPQAIANAVMKMTPEDVDYYLDPKNKDFKAAIDSVVFPDINAYYDSNHKNYQDTAAMALAESLLTQVQQTGKVPTPGEFDKVAQAIMDDTVGDERAHLQALSDMMHNPDVFAKMQEIQAKPELERTASDVYFGNTIYSLSQGNSEAFNELMSGKMMYVGVQRGGLIEGNSAYSYLSTEDPDQRDFDLSQMTDKQREVAQHIIDQRGFTDFVDEARMYNVDADNLAGDGTRAENYRDIVQKLSEMTGDERTKFFQDYQSRYQSDFASDFTSEVSSKERLSGDYQAVFDNLIKQDFVPSIADKIRWAVLDHGDFTALADEFSRLSYDQKNSSKSEYSSKYAADLDGTFMSLIGNNVPQEVAVSNALTPGEADIFQDFIDNSKFDSSGIEVDGTRDSLIKAMEMNSDLFAQYAANRDKISPEALASLQDYFKDAVARNQETKGKVAAVAEAAIDVALIAAAVATLAPSGGSSGMLAGTLLSAAHTPIIASIKGGGMITDAEMKDLLLHSSIDGALFGGPKALEAISRVTQYFNSAGRPMLESAVKAAYADEYGEMISAANTRVAEAATPELPTVVTNGAASESEVASIISKSDPVAAELPKGTTQPEAVTVPAQERLSAQAVETAAVEQAAPLSAASDSASALDGALFVPAVTALSAADIINNTAPIDFTPPAAPMPSDALVELATVRRGEGPWQSAERILAADGKKHGIDEVRALTKAIQSVYTSNNNGNGDMSGLKVKYTFVTKDNFDDLLAAVNNDAVKAVLMGLSTTS